MKVNITSHCLTFSVDVLKIKICRLVAGQHHLKTFLKHRNHRSKYHFLYMFTNLRHTLHWPRGEYLPVPIHPDALSKSRNVDSANCRISDHEVELISKLRLLTFLNLGNKLSTCLRSKRNNI